MKKVVIERLKAENCALFKAFEIMANGDNVIITGQNGAGKSTVRKMIEWCLLGSTLDGEKLIPCDGSGQPSVEIRLFEGEICTKIAKEISETRKNGRKTRTSNCFLNGIPATQKDIAGYFQQYADKEVVPYLLNPFKFLEVNVETQRRRILTGLFAEITDAEVISTDESLKELDFENLSRVKERIKHLKAESRDIPTRIDTLRSSLKEVTEDETLQAQINELEREKAAITNQLASWKDKVAELQKVQEKILKIDGELSRLVIEKQNLEKSIETNERHLSEMRQQWYEAVKGICRACGQKLPLSKVRQMQDGTKQEGERLKAETESLKSQLAEVREKIVALGKEKRNLVTPAGAEFSALAELSRRKDVIQREITLLEREKAASEYQIKLNAENERKIAELAAREQEVGKELSWCEKQIALFEKFMMKRAEMITDGINAHFEKIRWQMFETTKSGEVKNICTATLDGVPYELLSKGEKFRVALDVLQAFQTFYGVEFPLIIDDAESYTSNSYAEVENQLILLKVVEGQGLKIKVGDKE